MTTSKTMDWKRRNHIICGCKISPCDFCTTAPSNIAVQEIVAAIRFDRDMKSQCDSRDLRKETGRKGELLNA